MVSTTRRTEETSHDALDGAGNQMIKRYATVATIATSLIVATTGVLLFYHIGDRYLRSAHEWLGMAFVIATIFHLVRHSKTFPKLMGEARTQVAIVLAIAVTALFIVSASLSPDTHGRGKWHSEATPTSELAIEGTS